MQIGKAGKAITSISTASPDAIAVRNHVSQSTYFSWTYGGLLPDELEETVMRRLKALEDENSRLKKIVADLTLDREMLQDVIRRKL
jgi:putative transposase